MRKWITGIAIAGALMLLVSPAGAQDYRARVQGTVADASQGVLPGVTVTLVNDATGVSVVACHGRRGALPVRLRRAGDLHDHRPNSTASRRPSRRTSACSSAAT